MNDDDIINKADEWQRREQESRRRAEELRHERLEHRRKGMLKFMKWAGLILVGLGLSSALVIGISRLVQHRRAQAAVEMQEKRVRYEKYETAWKECLDALGLEKCEQIEVRLADRCLETRDGSRVKQCLYGVVERADR